MNPNKAYVLGMIGMGITFLVMVVLAWKDYKDQKRKEFEQNKGKPIKAKYKKKDKK